MGLISKQTSSGNPGQDIDEGTIMRKFFVAAAVAVACLVGSATNAEAAFQMKLSWTSGGGGSVTITDGGAGDSNGASGAITYIASGGSAGLFDIQVNTGLSKPSKGSADWPDMDLNFVVSKGDVGAETLTIEISDDGFTTNRPFKTQIGGTFSGSVSSVDASARYDDSNVVFGPGGGDSYSQSFNSSPFSGTGSFLTSGATPYSLTQKIVITAGSGSGTSSGDFEIKSVPAPAGLVLVATGLPVLGLGARLRRRIVRTV